MKGFLFFLVLSGIVLFLYVFSQREGFQDVPPDGASPGLNIPLISPRHQTLMDGAVVQPFTEPYTALLAPPPGQAASVNARPPENPALQKAVAGRIQSVYETMVGFFQTDAPNLQKMGDPDIQLPLTTARADLSRISDEMAVLSKNPGLPSSLTDEDLNGIEANVAYLQKKWRVIHDLNPYFPMQPVKEGFSSSGGGGGWFNSFFGGSQEGFQGGSTTGSDPSSSLIGTPYASPNTPPTTTSLTILFDAKAQTGTAYNIQYGNTTSGTMIVPANNIGNTLYEASILNLTPATPYYFTAVITNGGSSTSSPISPAIYTACPNGGSMTRSGSGSGSMRCSGGSVPMTTGSHTGGSSTDPITIPDIQDIINKCNIEILRLEASGATDTVTTQMISNIKKIQQGFQQLLAEVKNGDRTIDSIHMTQMDVKDILVQIGKNGGSGVSRTLDSLGINNLLSSLFPTYASGDISGAQVARQIFDKYLTNMSNNLSWDVEFNYKGQAEQDVAANYASAMNDARYVADTMGRPAASNTNTSTAGSYTNNAASYGGVFSSVIAGLTGQTPSSVTVTNGANAGGVNAGGSSSAAAAAAGSHNTMGFDWKKRSTEICNNIKGRGYKPYDFGCLDDPDARQHVNFSWRGYAKTVCTRLATLYDPSIPELCGCPPPSWNGWRP